jgi:ankyrin repeat protein
MRRTIAAACLIAIAFAGRARAADDPALAPVADEALPSVDALIARTEALVKDVRDVTWDAKVKATVRAVNGPQAYVGSGLARALPARGQQLIEAKTDEAPGPMRGFATLKIVDAGPTLYLELKDDSGRGNILHKVDHAAIARVFKTCADIPDFRVPNDFPDFTHPLVDFVHGLKDRKERGYALKVLRVTEEEAGIEAVSPDGGAKENIVLSLTNGMVQRYELFLNGASQGTIELANARVNAGIAPDVFVYVPPAGIRVEDRTRSIQRAGEAARTEDNRRKEAAVYLQPLIRRGDLKAIEASVKADPARVNAKDRFGVTPLCVAIVEKKNKEIVEFLLNHGADPNGPIPRLNSPPLPLAAEGDGEIARLLIEHGANVKGRNQRMRTALHLTGSAELAQLLIAKGADINVKDESGWTPLMCCAERAQGAVAKVLIAKGADIAPKDREGRTALRIALWTRGGHAVAGPLRAKILAEALAAPDAGAAVRAALSYDPGLVRTSDADRKTPLHVAAERGLDAAVVALVEAGADLDVLDGSVQTPLAAALAKGRYGIAEYLVSRGAGVRQQEVSGKYPLHLAVGGGPAGEKALKAILDAGADPDEWEPRERKTALHFAAERNDLTAVRLLLACGARTNLADASGATPLDLAKKLARAEAAALLAAPDPARDLMTAAADGNEPAARALLDKDPALVKAVNGFGETPLHVAARAGRRDVAALLIDRGADVKAVDARKRTLFHAVALCGDPGIEVAKRLIDHGAPLDARDADGLTPLLIAARRTAGRDAAKDLARLLVEWGANVTVADSTGATALAGAAFAGDVEWMTYLVDRGASVKGADHDGRTLLHYALAGADRPAVKGCSASEAALFLMSKGADLNAKDKKGRGPIWELFHPPWMREGEEPTWPPEYGFVGMLMHEGAAINEPDAEGVMPLRYVVNLGEVHLFEYLRASGATTENPNRRRLGRPPSEW